MAAAAVDDLAIIIVLLKVTFKWAEESVNASNAEEEVVAEVAAAADIDRWRGWTTLYSPLGA